MYSVSNECLEIIKSRTRKSYKWYGTITLTTGDVYNFNNSDIVAGSGVITRSCSSESSIEIGTVYASELVMSLLPSDTLDIDRYVLSNAVINLYSGVPLHPKTWGELSDYTWEYMSETLSQWDAVYEPIPMGIYTVSEAMRSNNAIKITAYDNMLKLDAALGDAELGRARSPYDWLMYICSSRITPGSGMETIALLPNQDRLLAFADVNNETKTWRDLLANLVTVLGCVAFVDRYGKLVLRPYKMTVDDTIGSDFRYSSDFSDFQSYYTGLRANYKAEALSEYVTNSDTDDGLVYDIGYNVFLQISGSSTRHKVLQAIIDSQENIKYTPFDVTMPSNPTLDPMDILQFEDNQSGDYDIAPITSQIIHIGGTMEVKCGGADPALTTVESRTTKAIDGLSSGTVSGGGSYAGTGAWLMIDSFPGTGETSVIDGESTATTSIVVTTTTDETRLQITWTGFYTLEADATVLVTVSVDGTTVYMVSEEQLAGARTFNVTTGYEVSGATSHSIIVYVQASGLTMNEANARMTVIGFGWNNSSSGTGGTENGELVKGISDDEGYVFPDDFEWSDVADDIIDEYDVDVDDGYYEDDNGNVYTDEDGDGIFEDENGNIYDGDGTYKLNTEQVEKIKTGLATLANDEEAIYDYMTDHSDSTGMPARIIVTNPPDTVDYNEGDTIDFTGIVVCAYASATTRTPFIREAWDGPRHNQVPYEELTFPVTIATTNNSN